MKPSIRKLLLAVAAMASIAAQADAFPSKPIRIVVPFAPGNGSDITARFMAERMAPILGQPVIVENRPGADGVIGMLSVRDAPADGYTIVQGGMSPAALNVLTIPDMKYDPVKDFKGLHGYLWGMAALMTAPNSPLRSVADLRRAAERDRKPLTVATSSAFQAAAVNMISKASGIAMQPVPYKGANAALADAIGGHVDLAYADITGAMGQIKQGAVRVLFVTGGQRSRQLPDVPTVREAGIPGVSITGWNALYVRDGTPEDVRAKLADAHRRVLESEDAKRFLGEREMYVTATSVPEMKAFQASEIEKYRKAVAPDAR